MSLLRRLARGFHALIHPQQADADVADEVAHYVEEATAAHVARGLTPEAARRAALVEIGGALAVREQVRASGWEHALETTLLDVRYALRRLRKNPAFTVTAVTTLAIGIGASTAVFSVVSPILLEPLPFPAAHRLVTLDDRNPDGVPVAPTLGTYDEVRARSRSFDALAAADGWQPSLSGWGTPEQFEGQRVTANYFDVFGTVPMAGRGFRAADDVPGAPDVVILSAALSERRFGGARAIVGRPIELDGDPYVVIGVMPDRFTNVIAPAVEIWAPLRQRSTANFNTREWGRHYQLVGRLAESATADAAMSEILAIGGAPIPAFPRPPRANLEGGMLVRPLQETITSGARPALFAIVASVSLLLAIASVNVANLLLARGAQRRAEFALRMALGASRRRVVRQLVTESLALALLGGSVGLGVAWLGVHALTAVSPPGLPRVDAIRLDAPVFVFAAALTTLVGLLAGLVPALRALRAEVTEELLRGSGRATTSRGSARSALVVAEVALAVVLLVSAGLLFRSVGRLTTVAPGFDPTRVVTMQVVGAGPAFDTDAELLRFLDGALGAVRHVAGVASAAFTSQLPLSGSLEAYGYASESSPAEEPGERAALRYAVTPDYFATMRIPLVAGRLVDATDRPGAPAAVVINERFARRLFGDGNPVGRRVRFGPQMRAAGPWSEVVGVVGDVRHALAVDAPDAFYVANGQWQWVDGTNTLVVRATDDPSALVPSIQRAVWSVNPNVPIRRVRTMDGYIAASAGNRRFALLAIETLAVTALLLAAVGLYGVISGGVTERVREIGIRTALGATPGAVVGQVVRHALALTVAGAAMGIVGGYAASRLIRSMLFGLTALDPVTYGAVTALMVAVALLAAWAPARRAVGVDPTVALRSE